MDIVHSDLQNDDASRQDEADLPATEIDDDDAWLDAHAVIQIDAALAGETSSKPAASQNWLTAGIAALTFHLLLFTLIGVLVASGPKLRWRIAKGNPDADGGPSTPESARGNDRPDLTAISLPRTPFVLPPSSLTSVIDDSQGMSSVLPTHLELPAPIVQDTLIGIGSASSSEAAPHFAAKPLKLNGSMGSQLAAAHQAAASVPPQVATAKGGKRGAMDGFDSRGLPIPDYPAESRRRGEEGVVVIDVEVLSDGSVGAVRVLSDAGHPRLGAAAAEKVKLAMFDPARVDGKPVVGHILIPYRFTLH